MKQNVFIVISYTVYASGKDYLQTISKDIRYVADVLSKATFMRRTILGIVAYGEAALVEV